MNIYNDSQIPEHLKKYFEPAELGQEETPEQYINSLVDGFRILRNALKDCGTLWVNIGDSYWGSGRGPEGNLNKGENFRTMEGKHKPLKNDTYKPKDLIGIPWLLAFALRQPWLTCNACKNENHLSKWGKFPNGRLICPVCELSKGHTETTPGWYLRQDIIWNKPNPMPESVTDRCTKSHEYIFLLSKSKTYYFDAEAIKEKTTGHPTGKNGTFEKVETTKIFKDRNDKGNTVGGNGQTRNKRSVWTVTTKPFKDAHFACYPHELVDPCIMAGTSENGCCPKCGGPWSRITEPVLNVGHTGETSSAYPEGTTSNRLAMLRQAAREAGTEYTGERKTIGWKPNCKCGILETVPAIVYDPFMGSGTTASAAKSLGRDYMGSELNPEYLKIQDRRLHKELGLFNQK